MAVALARPAYALYTRRLRRDVLRGRGAAAPRRDPRRQPALGAPARACARPAPAIAAGPTRSRSCSTGAPRSGSRRSRSGRSRTRISGAPGPQLTALFDVVCDKLDALEQRALRPGDRDARARDRALEDLPERVCDDDPADRGVDGGPAGPEPHDRARLQRPRRADRRLQGARAVARRAPACRPRSIAEEITRESLAARLYTAGVPDPDLIIRTSGEQRLSGFLPWQSAHSELYFTDVYWPAFRELDLLRALRTYQQRVRRHGL